MIEELIYHDLYSQPLVVNTTFAFPIGVIAGVVNFKSFYRPVLPIPASLTGLSMRTVHLVRHQGCGSRFYDGFLPSQLVDPGFQFLDLLLNRGQGLAVRGYTIMFLP